MTLAGWAVRVLGPVEVDGAAPLEPRDRMALGVLAVRRGAQCRPTSSPTPCGGTTRRHRGRSRCRSASAGSARCSAPTPSRRPRADTGSTLDGDDVDVDRFEALVERGRDLAATGEPDRAAATLPAGAGAVAGTTVRGARRLAHRAGARRRASRNCAGRVEEDWLDARLDAGDHREVAADAEPLVDEEPLRERRWAILALAPVPLRPSGRGAPCACPAPGERSVEQLGHRARARSWSSSRPRSCARTRLSRRGRRRRSVERDCPYKGLAPYDVGRRRRVLRT